MMANNSNELNKQIVVKLKSNFIAECWLYQTRTCIHLLFLLLCRYKILSVFLILLLFRFKLLG